MAIVGLIPAAGSATRLRGAITGSKEVLPIRDRPVMLYLVDRMWRGGAERIRVATRPDKEDVASLAASNGVEVITGQPASVGASLLLAAEDLDAGDIAIFGFPDTVWSPEDGFRPLVALVEDGAPLALGIFDSPYPERSDVATLDREGRVIRVDVKPDAPVATTVWAAGAARVEVLRSLLGEEDPGWAFRRAALQAPLAAARLGRVIDIGTPESLRSAADDAVFVETDEAFTSGGTVGRSVSHGPRGEPGPRPGR